MDKSFDKTVKKWSKEYWQNVWYYYKLHFIVVAILISIVGIITYEIATKKDPDVTVMYIGEGVLTEYEPELPFEEAAEDVDGDGMKLIDFMNFGGGVVTNPKGNTAFQQKAMVVMYADNVPIIHLVDDGSVRKYAQQGIYAPIEELAQKNGIAEERLMRDSGGVAVAIDVTGTKFAEKIGYSGKEELYMGFSCLRNERKDDEKYLKYYEEVKRLAELIAADEF